MESRKHPISCEAPPAWPAQAGLNRRRLLELGGISVLGLGLPEVVWAGAASTGQRATATSCIFIVQYGGCSHIDSWDPKPDSPGEIRGPYGPIETNVPGVRVSEMLPRLAKNADKYCLVRSMAHDNAEHNGGMHVCMTGHSRPAVDTPYFGSVVARARPSERSLPSYVWIENLDRDVEPRYLTGGFLGASYAPMRVATGEDNAAAPGFRVTAFDPPERMAATRLNLRRRLLGTVQAAPASHLLETADGGFRRIQERAFDLVASSEARDAFALDREPAAMRDRYGRHPFGQNLLLARRLVEAGVRLVSVNAWLGYPKGDSFLFTQGWDHHGTANQGSIFGTNQYGLGFALPRFDEAVAALLEDLHDRGLLESTLVVAVGEFGRTPKIVNNPHPGRDHWPGCYTAMLAGGGIRGGRVYGASDRTGAYPDADPVSPEDFGATLFHALGIAPETRLGLDGFTRPVSAGAPVLELFR
jgi:hypothetical protein